jgi:RNA polymerase sigma-70 factor (ECF subfamily)
MAASLLSGANRWVSRHHFWFSGGPVLRVHEQQSLIAFHPVRWYRFGLHVELRDDLKDKPMTATSLSLLERLRRNPSPTDWRRLHDVYLPLIQSWLVRIPGLQDEADDLTQEVLVVVFRKIANFERQREGSFRAWLRRVTVRRIRHYWRSRRRRPLVGLEDDETDHFLTRLEDPASDLSRQWDKDHDRHVFHRLLTIVKVDFQPETWEAFRRFALEGRSAAEVARELQTTDSAVMLAKSRILKRLREEAGVLLDQFHFSR